MKQVIIDQVDKYYTQKLLQHGYSSLGVDWNSKAAQVIRFEQVSKVICDTSSRFSICDYGCGLGDYDEYLSERYQDYDYFGFDVSESMIKTAKKKHPNAHFFCSSQLNCDFDYLVASGIFNVKQTIQDNVWFDYILETLNLFHQHVKKGFAFNCLTKYSDKEYMKEYLYYADPLILFDYCKKNFSRNVALLHNYTLYDFTILVNKEYGL